MSTLAMMTGGRPSIWLVIFQALLTTVLGSTFTAAGYPSPGNFNPDGISDDQAWALFESIGGFDNVPNASGRDGSTASVQWNASDGHSHSVVLETSLVLDYQDYQSQRARLHNRVVTVVYTRLDNASNEVFNKTVSVTSFGGLDGATYYLTAFIDGEQHTHIFWERSYTPSDVPERYWLFHEVVGSDGSIVASAEPFYFEMRGSVGLVYRHPIALYATLLTLLVVVSILAMVTVRRRRRKSTDRDKDGKSWNK